MHPGEVVLVLGYKAAFGGLRGHAVAGVIAKVTDAVVGIGDAD